MTYFSLFVLCKQLCLHSYMSHSLAKVVYNWGSHFQFLYFKNISPLITTSLKTLMQMKILEQVTAAASEMSPLLCFYAFCMEGICHLSTCIQELNSCWTLGSVAKKGESAIENNKELVNRRNIEEKRKGENNKSLRNRMETFWDQKRGNSIRVKQRDECLSLPLWVCKWSQPQCC